MIIILRGHIRNSFNNTNLYNLMKKICSIHENVQIFIHTWSIVQSNLSWRKLAKIDIMVTEQMIKNYFKDLSFFIKNITIDDDTTIKLVGKKDGVVSLSSCPLVGWKNMWYGKKSLIDTIITKVGMNDVIVNLRFDIFTNSNSLHESFILRFISMNKNKQFTKNIFPYSSPREGIDNIYIGNLNTMFNIVYHFHYNMDYILSKHNVYNQEFLVFLENNEIIRST